MRNAIRTPAATFFAMLTAVAAVFAASSAAAQSMPAALNAPIPKGQMHMIAAAKLIVADAEKSSRYYEQFFGMKQLNIHTVKDTYVEAVMVYDEGAVLALFQPLIEAQLKKPAAPVAFFYTPDFDKTVKSLEAAKQSVRLLPQAQGSTAKIAIATDPSGNAIEIAARDGKPAVGGSKLIVDNRAKAEEFITKVFGAKPGARYDTAGYDEVIMVLGEGPFLALFQPKAEAPLTKSQYPVVALYTRDFDNVLQRVKDLGFGYRELATSSAAMRIFIAKDPAGNSIEIIRRDP